jgi:DNA segregation ATPase FtsK/SpoIIIE-like protein
MPISFVISAHAVSLYPVKRVMVICFRNLSTLVRELSRYDEYDLICIISWAIRTSPPINLSGQNSDKSDRTDELIVKTLASIGAAALVLLILLYTNGYFRSTDRMKGRSQFHSTGQGISESDPNRQRIEKEEERLRMVREAEQQRIAQEEERLRNAREAERQRLAREESERQRVSRERVDSEKQLVAQEAERQHKVQQGVEAERQHKAQEEERQPIAQEEAEKKKRDDDLKQCLQAAEEAYSANWDRACRQIDGPPKCILPPLVLAHFDGPRRDARDECTKLYPVK